jgi:glycosyltransferase involved in cell wall biosynthesis
MRESNVMKVLVVPNKYPINENDTHHIFVKKFVQNMVAHGLSITVLVPTYDKYSKNNTTNIINNANIYFIYIPKILKYINRLPFIGKTLSFQLKKRLYVQYINKYAIEFDIIYGHFISESGLLVSQLSNIFNKKSFMIYGESSNWSIKDYRSKWLYRILLNLNFIVSVSTGNTNRLIKMNIVDKDKILTIPNAIDTNNFFPRDMEYSRKVFKLNKKYFIFSFVGQLIERKGINNLLKALDIVENVYLIIAGKGPVKINHNRVLYCGIVSSNQMPFFLSSSNAFILPTFAEGCSNAILEAIGCGLPIISSNLDFNFDILNEKNSILIDPYSIEEIANAMIKLRDDPLTLKKLGDGSLETRDKLSYDTRIKKIIDCMKTR